MVKWWDIYIDKGIELTKMRIAHHEKHGVGEATMKDKSILKKQQRHRDIRRNN